MASDTTRPRGQLHPTIRVSADREPKELPPSPSPLTDLQMREARDLILGGGFQWSLFPIIGDHPIYEPVDYYLMSKDRPRELCYEEALRVSAPGKIVVDVGTGSYAVWAVSSARFGARKVYAIEESPDAFEQARDHVRQLGLQSIIEVIQGSSGSVALPEQADLCVSEIIGCVGSCEGAGNVLRDVRRQYLKPGGQMVPYACDTYAALVALPADLDGNPRFGPWGAYYTDRIFRAVGRAFDLRLGFFGGVELDSLLSQAMQVEHLVMGQELDASPRTETLSIERPGRAAGLVLWIRLYGRPGGSPISTLERECLAWYPAFFPLFHPGEPVESGDALRLTWTWTLSDDGIHPDYAVEGVLQRRSRPDVPFRADFPHHSAGFRTNDFYRALFEKADEEIR